ncbi:MAG: phosphoenolpyruvate carboxykinase (ATP) [Deltaproteobacteria bacterium]|nr:MAG: phosphoenolpyruvate carboxykinase (ATP) [Deltaproteobacteria bacterium]TNF31083.1 MAG: phosphoenolpyruvate carboxykinase (ATP) [Deltaproteobacteria bacterium]
MTNFYADLGLKTDNTNREIFINSPRNFLIEQAVRKGHGSLTEDGSLVVLTGKHTGRSAGDKYVVKSPSTEKTIWWENSLNEMTYENFEKLKAKVVNYLNQDGKDLFITERSVGAVAEHNIGVRTITDHPSHALFSKHLFRPKMRDFKSSDFTILHAPELEIDPAEFKTKTGTVIATCFDTNTTIIVGTLYAGEIKKSMFCIMNYVLPEKDVLPMHAGACRMENEDVSIFFGLSGTGKTTLSTDEGTYLIGDDEHGLSDEGVFNFEGGCYAKTYKLSKETEPGIFDASNRFGALLENVVLDKKTGKVDFFDKSIAENGRSSYPLRFIEGLEKTSKGKVPNNIFFLTADAFGVLPPIAKLTKEQAMFYFVLGYTSKLAGTEIGVKEPQATFSPCFGAPFMLRHPSEYAKLLGVYLDRYDIDVWLVNTGWTGGAYGVGQRFPLHVTREIIRTIQANKLNKELVETDPIFGLRIPQEVGTVSHTLLNPQKSWDKEADYQQKAMELATSFHKQMKSFGDFYSENIGGAPTYGA